MDQFSTPAKFNNTSEPCFQVSCLDLGFHNCSITLLSGCSYKAKRWHLPLKTLGKQVSIYTNCTFFLQQRSQNRITEYHKIFTPLKSSFYPPSISRQVSQIQQSFAIHSSLFKKQINPQPSQSGEESSWVAHHRGYHRWVRSKHNFGTLLYHSKFPMQSFQKVWNLLVRRLWCHPLFWLVENMFPILELVTFFW